MSTTTIEGPSPAQQAFIRLLLDERQITEPILNPHSRRDASLLIQQLLRAPHKNPGLQVTEPGVYEHPTKGVFVVKPTRDKQRLYAKRLIEINPDRLNANDERVQIEFVYAPGAIRQLTPDMRMPFEKAKELTIRYGRCIVCGRHLKAADSVERGIGPVCAKSFSGVAS